MATIDVIELFAGIGAQAQALDELNIDHRIVAISEIDPYAETSYRAIHDPEVNNLGDITKIASLPHCDLLTYSFPCTDISLAGNQAGLTKGSGTRSGLLWEVERLLEDYSRREDLPKYLLLENVKNLVGKQFKADFDDWCLTLELLGYTNYWKVLNAKNYGIPQNRERVIMLSIKSDNGGQQEIYEWPDQIPLKQTLYDLLEEEVDEKYFISKEQLQRILSSNFNQERCRLQQKECVDTLLSRDWKDPKLVQVGKLVGGKWDAMHEQSKRVYDADGIAPTLHTNGGGNLEPKVYIGAFRGRNPDNPSSRTAGIPTQQRLEVNLNGTSNTITTVQKDNVVVSGLYTTASKDFQRPPLQGLSRTLKATTPDAGIMTEDYVRKLTPRECWRLMGFTDESFDKARIALMNKHYHGRDKANTQLYKQAGNSIVVDVLKAVFNNIKGFDRL